MRAILAVVCLRMAEYHRDATWAHYWCEHHVATRDKWYARYDRLVA